MAKVFVFVTTLGNAKLVINVAIYAFVRYLMSKGKFVGRSIPTRITRSRLTDSRAWHRGTQIACRLPSISRSLAVKTNLFQAHRRSILLQNKMQLPADAVSQLASLICLRVLGHLFFLLYSRCRMIAFNQWTRLMVLLMISLMIQCLKLFCDWPPALWLEYH